MKFSLFDFLYFFLLFLNGGRNYVRAEVCKYNFSVVIHSFSFELLRPWRELFVQTIYIYFLQRETK